MRTPLVAWLLLLLVGLAGEARSQINTAEITGVVRDVSGAVLPGVTITATYPDTGAVVERVTDAEGRFFLPALRIGRWDVEANLPGFTSQTRRGLELEVGRSLAIELTLGIPGLAERIVVQTTTPLLQTTPPR